MFCTWPCDLVCVNVCLCPPSGTMVLGTVVWLIRELFGETILQILCRTHQKEKRTTTKLGCFGVSCLNSLINDS